MYLICNHSSIEIPKTREPVRSKTQGLNAVEEYRISALVVIMEAKLHTTSG